MSGRIPDHVQQYEEDLGKLTEYERAYEKNGRKVRDSRWRMWPNAYTNTKAGVKYTFTQGGNIPRKNGANRL